MIIIENYKEDDRAFIFTLKNPHRVEPTRYMKRKDNNYAIECDSNYGPIFGNKCGSDICIYSDCNKEDRCYIWNNGANGYACHSAYTSSLFVNTAGSDKKISFSVLDYEVFGIDFENRENINKLCKYPDIIWEYIETKDISEESLKQFNDDTELLNDLDAIHCKDSKIRFKISRYYFKSPSELLSNTQLVDKKYDSYLRKWAGNNRKWRLLYRASEHGYTAKSFHECCDDKGPTLIVIKSSGGWLFGGYTTQSWSGSIYYDIVIIIRCM